MSLDSKQKCIRREHNYVQLGTTDFLALFCTKCGDVVYPDKPPVPDSFPVSGTGTGVTY